MKLKRIKIDSFYKGGTADEIIDDFDAIQTR